jgi:hypothetical protein
LALTKNAKNEEKEILLEYEIRLKQEENDLKDRL